VFNILRIYENLIWRERSVCKYIQYKQAHQIRLLTEELHYLHKVLSISSIYFFEIHSNPK